MLLHLRYIRTVKNSFCTSKKITVRNNFFLLLTFLFSVKRKVRRFAFVRFLRRFPVIFILNLRHGGTSGTTDSVSVSWKSHPFEDLPKLPSLPDSPTKGCCDWTEVALSSCVSSPFRKAIPDLEAAYFSLALLRSWRMASAADGVYSARRIHVFPMLCIQFSRYMKFDFYLLSLV